MQELCCTAGQIPFDQSSTGGLIRYKVFPLKLNQKYIKEVFENEIYGPDLLKEFDEIKNSGNKKPSIPLNIAETKTAASRLIQMFDS